MTDKVMKNEPIFDWDRIDNGDQHLSGYRVRYVVHDGKKLEYEAPPKDNSAACYASLLDRFRKTPDKNFVSTSIDIVTHRPKHRLTVDECIAWVDLCQVYGLLPWYIIPKNCFHVDEENPEAIEGRLVLISKDYPQGLMYVYLDNFRHMREDPGFVKSMLYLCNEVGMDFYAAYILASHLNITGTGHHCILVQRGVYNSFNKPAPKDIHGKMNLKMARNFFLFLFDKNVDQGDLIPKANGWSCNGRINKVTNIDLVVPVKSLLAPEISTIIREKNDEKAAKLCEEFNKTLK